MTTGIRLPLALALTLAAVPLALAEHEDLDVHAHGTTKTITLEGQDIRPATTEMQHGDVVSFTNYSTHSIRVTFTEPKDMENKIRCGLVREAKAKGRPSAPWAVFTWTNGRLVGTVPPGQFASVCSLEPGAYAFTTETLGANAGPANGVLSAKGTIEVK